MISAEMCVHLVRYQKQIRSLVLIECDVMYTFDGSFQHSNTNYVVVWLFIYTTAIVVNKICQK